MNFEHTSLLQQPAQQPPYSATETPQQHFRQQLSPTAVYSEGGGACNSSESSAMLLDAGQHRVVSCGQQRGGLLSEQQQQMGHNNSSLYDWDINDPDIPAKVHLYVSTNLFFLTYKMILSLRSF
jgi:hypothetical protein